MPDPTTHDKYSGITNEILAEAYGPWVRGDYPGKNNLGDVALAMRSGEEPALTAEQVEAAALEAELDREELSDVVRPTPRQYVFKGHRPARTAVL